MASIRSALFSYLSGKTGVTAIVGTSPVRLYPLARPQGGELPAMTYARVTGGHDHNLTAASGTAIPTFELDCFAETYAEADALAEAIRQVMQGFSGSFGTGGNAVAVKAVLLDDESDGYDLPQDDSDRGAFFITLRYRIRYSESIPTP